MNTLVIMIKKYQLLSSRDYIRPFQRDYPQQGGLFILLSDPSLLHTEHHKINVPVHTGKKKPATLTHHSKTPYYVLVHSQNHRSAIW